MKRFSKMFEMFIIFVGLVVILSCSNQVQDLSPNITYDFSSDGEPIDVVILAGQSNATGCALCEDLREYVTPKDFELLTNGFANQKIIWFNDGSDFDMDSSRGCFSNVQLGQSIVKEYFGPEIGISYVFNQAGKKLIIVKYTSPGSFITRFVSVSNDSSVVLNQTLEEFLIQSLQELVNEGYSPAIKAFCWMQGEADSSWRNTAERYLNLEKGLITDVRRKFGKDIVFIDAKITDWNLVTPFCFQNIVNEAKINLSDGVQNYMINSDNLSKKEDDLAHYDSRSQFELGKRFGEMILNKCY